MEQLQAVNLGGWLVVEKWMTPSLFAGTAAADEYTLSQTADGRRRIERHRQDWVTEEDISWLYQQGVRLVRIPVGYWLFTKADPYVSGTAPLDNCITWCERQGMQVLIDLHGVPGSQNGHDHSGQAGAVGFWDDAAYQRQAIDVLCIIAERYGQSPALWGVQLLNEPTVGVRLFQLRRWYRQAYEAIDELLPSAVKIVFSDGFRPRLLNGALKGLPRAVMDVHHYQFATKYNCCSRRSLALYTARLRRRQRLIARLQRTQQVMIGEWSGVLGHELLTAEKITDEAYQATWLPWHISLQRQTFAQAIAMSYWSYKVEDSESVWHMRMLVERGILRYNAQHE